jgi:hypothetical protein
MIHQRMCNHLGVHVEPTEAEVIAYRLAGSGGPHGKGLASKKNCSRRVKEAYERSLNYHAKNKRTNKLNKQRRAEILRRNPG